MFPIDIQRNRSLIRRGKLQLFVFKKNPDAHHGALDNIKCKKAHWNVLTNSREELLGTKTVCIQNIFAFWDCFDCIKTSESITRGRF